MPLRNAEASAIPLVRKGPRARKRKAPLDPDTRRKDCGEYFANQARSPTLMPCARDRGAGDDAARLGQ